MKCKVIRMGRIIFHIDMNAFFASCEQVIHPELRGKAIAVVGDPKRRSGIVLAASYEAKAYGIKTTMPIYQAQQCYKDVILVQSTYGLYKDMSRKVMAIFDQYTPLKEQLSIDEAFLDMTGTEHLFGESIEAAFRIQNQINEELDLGCSIGIAPNKFLAKTASDYKKPMGITRLFEEDIETILWPMPVAQMYGIGKRTSAKLEALGIKTIGELAKAQPALLLPSFGEKATYGMLRSANGQGKDQLVPNGTTQAKSVGNELTYQKDLTGEEEIRRELLVLSDTVGYRLRHKMLKGRTLQIKIKYNDFTVMTRSHTMAKNTHETDVIFQEALRLVTEHKKKKPIRLLGISLSQFDEDHARQLSLFDNPMDEPQRKVDEMVDRVRDKYGYNAISRASILDKRHGKL